MPVDVVRRGETVRAVVVRHGSKRVARIDSDDDSFCLFASPVTVFPLFGFPVLPGAREEALEPIVLT